MTKVLLRDINRCSDLEKNALLPIRNKPSVRNFMYNNHEITQSEHDKLLDRLGDDKTQRVFVVKIAQSVCGVLSINFIDYKNSRTDWAFYVDEEVPVGLGPALEFWLVDFIFFDMDFEKLNCEVMETNSKVVDLHKCFGFQEEGFKKNELVRGSSRLGIHMLGITKDEWLRLRPNIAKRYKNLLSKFEFKVEV